MHDILTLLHNNNKAIISSKQREAVKRNYLFSCPPYMINYALLLGIKQAISKFNKSQANHQLRIQAVFFFDMPKVQQFNGGFFRIGIVQFLRKRKKNTTIYSLNSDLQ